MKNRGFLGLVIHTERFTSLMILFSLIFVDRCIGGREWEREIDSDKHD